MSDEEKNYKYGYLFHRFSESIKNQKTWTDIFKDWVFILLSFFVVTICILTIYGIYLLALDLVFEASGEPGKETFANIRNSLFILAALIGIPFFFYRTWLAGKQTKTAEHQSETARDRAYTELFTKAIEQLGAEKPAKKVIMGIDQDPTTIDDYVPNIEVRIGAIFALERIMKDSDKDAAAVVDTLAAYVRENCGEPQELECEIPEKQEGQSITDWVDAIKKYFGNPLKPKEGSLAARARALKNPATNRVDIKTALTVLGRRPLWLKDPSHFKDEKRQRADLSNVNLQGWDLSGVDLEHCNLTNAKMQGAYISNTQMQGAYMRGAKMQGADMGFAQMQGANMNYAEMQGANMFGAQINEVQITEARRTAASVIWVDFTKASFDFEKLQAQLPEMFGNKEHTTLPEGMAIPEYWSEAHMGTLEGHEQFEREWADFKKKMGVE